MKNFIDYFEQTANEPSFSNNQEKIWEKLISTDPVIFVVMNNGGKGTEMEEMPRAEVLAWLESVKKHIKEFMKEDFTKQLISPDLANVKYGNFYTKKTGSKRNTIK